MCDLPLGLTVQVVPITEILNSVTDFMTIPMIIDHVLVQIEMAGWGLRSEKLKGKSITPCPFCSVCETDLTLRSTTSSLGYLDHRETSPLCRARRVQLCPSGGRVPTILTYKARRHWQNTMAHRPSPHCTSLFPESVAVFLS